MFFTRLIRHFGSKLRQSIEPVSEKQSYLFEALVLLLLLLLLVLGIVWL
ncbi:hypothetical protein [Larkinella rosea]|nr:hypothetical protein [Larkinella rosea]